MRFRIELEAPGGTKAATEQVRDALLALEQLSPLKILTCELAWGEGELLAQPAWKELEPLPADSESAHGF